MAGLEHALGIPAGWAIAQRAVLSVADAGTVLLPACLIAAAKGAQAGLQLFLHSRCRGPPL